ncbi:MAG: DUF504 domain-containing protein [Methanothrix sp.]|jgi:hypothetical protein|nr:DUF504 domain-containing protein [Methanothrix sp.]
MRRSRALLLRLLHDQGFDFAKASVEYIDRGSSGDTSQVFGEHILRLEQGWMEIVTGSKVKFIPFHRILRITYDGSVLWEKRGKDGSETQQMDD